MEASALSSSWRPRLCPQELEGKGIFVWASIVTDPALAPVWAGALSGSPVPTQVVQQSRLCTPHSERPISILNILSREKG
jgi:hypothetical protein